MSGAAVGGKMIASILILKENGEVLFEFRAASIHTITISYRMYCFGKHSESAERIDLYQRILRQFCTTVRQPRSCHRQNH